MQDCNVGKGFAQRHTLRSDSDPIPAQKQPQNKTRGYRSLSTNRQEPRSVLWTQLHSLNWVGMQGDLYGRALVSYGQAAKLRQAIRQADEAFMASGQPHCILKQHGRLTCAGRAA